jgi:hypothetical protein
MGTTGTFTITLKLGDQVSYSLFKMLSDINDELNARCPEIFEYSQIDEISSDDIADGFIPNELQIDGKIEAEDPAKYATTKQLLHMVMKRYESRYKIKYTISASQSE